MSNTTYLMPVDQHDALVTAAYTARGFTADEAAAAARFCNTAAWHGIKTHNAIKALHLDDLFGSLADPQGCVPGATVEVKSSRFGAAQQWNANKKLGQAIAFDAIDACIEMSDAHGVGMVSIDNAFHYLWGGGYVIDAARRGYIAYTNCTSTLAEVVPFGGKFPTLGTNPHSWGFPTQDVCGFPICIDWATSTVAMGRVQQLLREGKQLPPGAAVDKEGHETTDPNHVAALLPFGAHKGYGLSLINELYGAYIGGSLPTIRGVSSNAIDGEKTTSAFFFMVIHPEAMDCNGYAKSRDQKANVQAVLDDIMGHGNLPPDGRAMLPGKIEADNAALSAKHNALLFTEAELGEFKHIAEQAGVAFDASNLQTV